MNEPSIHCFITLIKDSYVRFGFQGAQGQSDGQAYCEALPCVVSIEYLGALWKVSDVDKGDRKGEQRYRDSIIVSCKHLGCLRSCDEDKVHGQTTMQRQRKGFNAVQYKQRSALDETTQLGNSQWDRVAGE